MWVTVRHLPKEGNVIYWLKWKDAGEARNKSGGKIILNSVRSELCFILGVTGVTTISSLEGQHKSHILDTLIRCGLIRKGASITARTYMA